MLRRGRCLTWAGLRPVSLLRLRDPPQLCVDQVLHHTGCASTLVLRTAPSSAINPVKKSVLVELLSSLLVGNLVSGSRSICLQRTGLLSCEQPKLYRADIAKGRVLPWCRSLTLRLLGKIDYPLCPPIPHPRIYLLLETGSVPPSSTSQSFS